MSNNSILHYSQALFNTTNQTIQNQTLQNQTNSTQNVSEFSSVLKQVQTPKTLDTLFETAASTYNLPVSLLKAVAKAESGYRADAVSPCGAQGIMQLMPQTSASMGVKDPFDPEENIMAGAKCLAQKIKSYDGDIKLTLASYNAGSGNVKKYGGIPPFKETKNYIEKVLNYMKTEDNSSLLSKNLETQTPFVTTGGFELGSAGTEQSLLDSGEVFSSIELSEALDYATDSIDALKTQARFMQYQSMLASINAFSSNESTDPQTYSTTSKDNEYTIEDYTHFLDLFNLTF